MEINEIIEMLEGLEGSDEARIALTEYGNVSEGANARIAELEAEAQALRDKYTETAARNYELMRGATAAEYAEDEGDEAAEDFAVDINDLFS